VFLPFSLMLWWYDSRDPHLRPASILRVAKGWAGGPAKSFLDHFTLEGAPPDLSFARGVEQYAIFARASSSLHAAQLYDGCRGNCLVDTVN